MAVRGFPGISLWQAFCAAWNCDEPGSMPLLGVILSWTCPPEKVGSGNFGSPCERIQPENLSIRVCILACWAVLGARPFGRSFRQALWADWNCDELGSTPSLELNVSAPWLSGSGKLGTPCARMQEENAMPEPRICTRPPD